MTGDAPDLDAPGSRPNIMDRVASGTGARVLTAAVLIPVVVAAILWAPNWLVAIIAAVVVVLALLEFFFMAARAGFEAYRFWTCAGACAVMVEQWYAAHQASNAYAGEALYGLHSPRFDLEFVLFGFLIGTAIITFGTHRNLAEILPAVSVSAAGLVFIAIPFSAVVRLHGFDVVGPELLLFTVILVWVGDTAAYFVGRAFGRWKMAPMISPKKTWEGALANFIGSLFVAALFSRWSRIPAGHLLVMAAVGNVAGQAGDIFKSTWKRGVGVKDSGTILPGHGGMLDRIDSLILAAPAVWYYFEWIVMRRY